MRWPIPATTIPGSRTPPNGCPVAYHGFQRMRIRMFRALRPSRRPTNLPKFLDRPVLDVFRKPRDLLRLFLVAHDPDALPGAVNRYQHRSLLRRLRLFVIPYFRRQSGGNGSGRTISSAARRSLCTVQVCPMGLSLQEPHPGGMGRVGRPRPAPYWGPWYALA